MSQTISHVQLGVHRRARSRFCPRFNCYCCCSSTRSRAIRTFTSGYMDSVWQDMTVSDGKCIKAYERQTNHDVKSIEYFLKYKIAPDISSPPPMHLLNPTPEIDPERTANGGKHERNKNTGAKPEGRKTEDFYEQLSSQDRLTLRQCKEFVHFGCTSEDINNVAYALMMQAATSKVLRPAMWEALEAVVTLATENAGAAMLSRTHGQPATPTTFGKPLNMSCTNSLVVLC
eukprot:GHVQ01008935.1.p2 GENE.GHVQ01008935.1~~GHVQ01008935.1.p2  ORF type:complete len:230 (-),score=16.90 GHVQ01008935.1:2429-3118(-)